MATTDQKARAGRVIRQAEGYSAFIPAPLPPDPPLAFDSSLATVLAAGTALGRLDGVAATLPCLAGDWGPPGSQREPVQASPEVIDEQQGVGQGHARVLRVPVVPQAGRVRARRTGGMMIKEATVSVLAFRQGEAGERQLGLAFHERLGGWLYPGVH